MHAEHHDQDSVERLGVGDWMTDANEQARDSRDKAFLPGEEPPFSMIESCH